MKTRIFKTTMLVLSALLSIGILDASAHKVSEGKLKVYEQFKSKYIESRDIYVWIPENYSPRQKYSVLYMHDGQMLWDSTATWNKQEWMIDEIASRLMEEGKTEKFIVVGIHSHPSGKRFYEYYPEKALQYMDETTFSKSGNSKDDYFADDYLKFLVKELKPFIDRNYSTHKGVKNTFIMGSSMGGLISLYAICEYPEVFGGAGCISTHFPMILDQNWLNGKDSWAAPFRTYLEKNLPKTNSRMIYMDRGDQTLDASYPYFQDKINELMVKKGWKLPYWTSKVYPEAAHQERDWARRVATPMQFLLSKKSNEKIDKIDPPMWWVGMKTPKLQLMVYGNNIATYAPEISYPGIEIKEVIPCESPNYLIIYLDVRNAKSGKFDIVFKGKDKVLTYPYEFKERRENAEITDGFNSSDVMYLLMPDRFANGNPDNDYADTHFPDVVDRNDPEGRHGGDLAGVEQHIDYLEDLGITAVWLTPVVVNDMERMSYHGYSATDYYKIDPRFGTNEDYRRLSEKMREHGIKMVKDLVFNHCGSEHIWAKDLPMRSWFNYPYYFTPCNHNKNSFYDPYNTETGTKYMINGWFVPTMPDLNQSNRLVGDYLIQCSIWWIEYARLGGIRQDTFPYPDKAMMERWCKEVFEEYPDFNIVGESAVANAATSAYWQRGHYLNPTATLKTTMDFNLRHAAKGFFEETYREDGLRRLFDLFTLDGCYPDIFNVLRFYENHDMSRFFRDEPENLDIFTQSMTVLLTIQGIPQLYYGQEYAAWGTGPAYCKLRNDMPGGWKGDESSIFEGKNIPTLAADALRISKKILNWRKGNNIVAKGDMIHFLPYKGCYVYERHLGDESFIVVLNGTKEEVDLPLAHYEEVINGYTHGHEVLTDHNFHLGESLHLPPHGTMLIELSK